MKRNFTRIQSFVIVFLMIVSILPTATWAANSGNIYYVAKNGSDDNIGDILAPFATISRAASVMQAGDVCYIREGIYYETISAELSGEDDAEISFRAYQNEDVILSGGKPITNWQLEEGNIYSADMSWDIYDGAGNMIFADGELCTEAMWPNIKASELLEKENYAVLDVGSSETEYGLEVSDSDLPDLDLVGAQMWCAHGPSYWSTVTEITAQNKEEKTITIKDVFSSVGYRPKAGNIYYIKGSKALLDSPGEWFKDTVNKKLYFYAPDGKNPNEMNIEAKEREYVINLNNSSYVNFERINVRGSLIQFGQNTHHCRFSKGVIESLDYKMVTGQQGAARGVIIDGSYNELSNCEIKNMYGEGVTLKGNNNYVVNNYIHDINFEHTYSDGVYIAGSKHLISHNTVCRTGRSTIGGQFTSSIISYNDLSDTCRLSQDGGTVYFNSYDYKNTEIHHNVLHGAMNNDGLQYGMYLDSMTTGMIIYNNLVYGMESEQNNSGRLTLCVNPESMNNVFVNNTFVNIKPTNTYGSGLYGLPGCVFINNLFRSGMHDLTDEKLTDMGVTLKNNLHGEKTAFKDFWKDSGNNDYTLSDSSEAIDAGCVVSGITDGYVGDAPDCGAFEYGKEPWTAGHDFNTEYEAVYEPNDKIPYRNILENGGFETGFDGWTTSGNTERFASSSWTLWCAFSKEGNYSAKLGSGDTLSRKITGLKPYTCYKLGAFGMLAGDVTLGSKVKNFYDKNNELIIDKSQVSTDKLEKVGALEFDVDFGSKQVESLTVGIRDCVVGSKIKISAGSIDNVLSTIDVTEKAPGIGWSWFTVALSNTLSGTQKIFILLDGDFSSARFGGFYPDFSTDGEEIVISATSGSDQKASISFNSKQYAEDMPSFSIVTGAKGEIDLTIEKKGDKLFGYVDYVNLCENPDIVVIPKGEVLFLEKSVRDIDGDFISNDSFNPNTFNMFEISLKNATNERIKLNGILGIYNEFGMLINVSSVGTTAEKDKQVNLILGTDISAEAKKAKFFVFGGDSGLMPLIKASVFNSGNVTSEEQ